MSRDEKKIPVIKVWQICAILSLLSGALAYLCYQYDAAGYVGLDSDITGFRAAIIAAVSLLLTAFLLWCPPKALIISIVRRDAVGAAARKIARNWDSLAETNQPGGTGKIFLGGFSHNLGVLNVRVKYRGTCSRAKTWEDFGKILVRPLAGCLKSGCLKLKITPDPSQISDDGTGEMLIPLLIMDATKEQP